MLEIHRLLLMLWISEIPLFFLFHLPLFFFCQKDLCRKSVFKAGEVSTACSQGQWREIKESGKTDRNTCLMMVCGPFELQFRKASATCNLNLKALIFLWGSILLPVMDHAKGNIFGSGILKKKKKGNITGQWLQSPSKLVHASRAWQPIFLLVNRCSYLKYL